VAAVYFFVVIIGPVSIFLYGCCCKARSNQEYARDVDDSFISSEYEYVSSDNDSAAGLLNASIHDVEVDSAASEN